MEITVNVGSGIVYVGGTVNGVTKVFEQIDNTGIWYTNVDQAEDSSYVLDLEMIDGAGNHSTYSNTIYYELPSFIYDRTQKDIEEHTAKAYLNAKDLNRIEKDIGILAEYLNVDVTVKTWEIGSLPRASDFTRILENVKLLVDAYMVREDTPVAPVQPLNTYQKWNDIEHILHDLFWIYIGNLNNIYYCSEMSCGEEIGVI